MFVPQLRFTCHPYLTSGWCLWGRRRAWGPPEWKINNEDDLGCLPAHHCELYRTITFLLLSCYHPKWQHACVCKQQRLSAVWSSSERQRTGRLRASKGAPEVCGTGTVCLWEGTLWKSGTAEFQLMSSIIDYPGNAHTRLAGDSKPPLDVSVWVTSVLGCTSDPDSGTGHWWTDGWIRFQDHLWAEFAVFVMP